MLVKLLEIFQRLLFTSFIAIKNAKINKRKSKKRLKKIVLVSSGYAKNCLAFCNLGFQSVSFLVFKVPSTFLCLFLNIPRKLLEFAYQNRARVLLLDVSENTELFNASFPSYVVENLNATVFVSC